MELIVTDEIQDKDKEEVFQGLLEYNLPKLEDILLQAEKNARERGCRYCFLDTFSFQAPQFYKKLGYKEVFALENYPVSGKRHYFTKEL